jgi:hypothetical protein
MPIVKDESDRVVLRCINHDLCQADVKHLVNGTTMRREVSRYALIKVNPRNELILAEGQSVGVFVCIVCEYIELYRNTEGV